MLPWRAWTDAVRARLAPHEDAGSAALEFIFVGVLMLVPLVYLIVTLGLIQGQTLGTEAGARHIARAMATAHGEDAAARRADEVLQAVVADYDIDAESVELSVDCTPRGAACPSAGVTVRTTVRARVALPLVPQVLGMRRWASIPVESTAVQHVSQFWGTE